MIIIKGIN